ncbi:unnamed protein product [Urochloa decumbens]|uniref:Knottin scorpion toxin-like domain-containing protein n=1 Tax=Urochloa decumbens TaxID=240449 RepID=A0ABC9AZH7_9POAL
MTPYNLRMEPSPRKNLSAAAATILLLIILTAESSESSRDGCNEHLSGRYEGVCWRFIKDDDCSIVCRGENSDNIYGFCQNFQCWCYTKCESKIVAPAGTPIRP